jgi:heat shock protein HtpX
MTHPDERPVSENAPPILVYDRIEANRRKTRLLLTAFAVAFLPAVSSGSLFIVPYLTYRLYAARPEAAASLFTHGTLDLWGLPTPHLWFYAGVTLVSMAIVALAFVATTVFLSHRYGSRVLLRLAHARPVDPGQERDLVQVVESLCIGAGLPLPHLYLIESATPNAFAAGRTPHDASLVVTRGLLGLLDRRELEGVIAHELSHIGNHDIGLSTTLAGLVGTLWLPLRLFSAPFLFAFRRQGVSGVVTVVAFCFTLFLARDYSPFGHYSDIKWVMRGDDVATTTLYSWWWFAFALISPLYVVFVAPVVALLIRQAVSHQREFLADADAALLTGNPGALALALVKIGAVRGERLRVGEGTVHLYFVDPLSKRSWLHALFPSHPLLQNRVELLARMGNGIAPSAIQAARDAGASFQHTKPGVDEVHAPLPDLLSYEPASSTQATEPTGTSDDGFTGFTRVYDRPGTGSRMVAVLPEDTVVKVEHRERDFVRVATESGVAGWVFRSAPLDIRAVAAADHALTPLYEQPDGWSRVLALLPESAFVIPIATEGHFIRVTTPAGQAGYVSRSAPLTALKNFSGRL